MERKRLTEKKEEGGNNYFPPKSSIQFISSGCLLLDCVLGGGWPLSRVANIVGDKSSGKCAKDYFLLTSEGLVYSDDLEKSQPFGASNIDWTLALDRNTHVRATHFWKEKVSLTYELNTSHGLEIIGTSDHKIQILLPDGSFSMKRLADIQEGEWAVVSTNTNLFPKHEVEVGAFKAKTEARRYKPVVVPQKVTPLLASWLGAVIADGTVSSGPLVITAFKPWKRRLLKEWSEKLFPGSFKMKLGGSAYSKQVKELFAHLYGKSPVGSTARYKQVPPIILRSPAPVQAAFIKALMSFDGEVTTGICWSTASRRLAREVQMMLMNFGIIGTLKRSYSKEYNWNYYSLSIYGERFDDFLEKIGVACYHRKTKRSTRATSEILSIPYGNAMLKAELLSMRKRLGWSKNGKLGDGRRSPKLSAFCFDSSISYPTFQRKVEMLRGFASPEFFQKAELLLEKRFVFSKILKKITHRGEQVVSDVHVPSGHLFWCNGFVNHNTLLAIEACANFAKKYPKGKIFYREAEAAFDEPYAAELGLPTKRVDFGPEGLDSSWDTLEDIFADLEKSIEICEKNEAPGLYIVDSLDALTTKAALKRDVEKGSYNLEKPKIMGQMFQQLVRRLKRVKMCLIIISQVRDRIGITFGERHTRSGGKALDFYASQVVWLSHMQILNQTRGGVKRATGVLIKAKCKKNKIAKPFGECMFEITFGYGVEDIRASLEYLAENKGLPLIHITEKDLPAYFTRVSKLNGTELQKVQEMINGALLATWQEVEGRFTSQRRKYE